MRVTAALVITLVLNYHTSITITGHVSRLLTRETFPVGIQSHPSLVAKFGPTRVLFRALALGLPLVLALDLALGLALVLAHALEAGRTPPLLGAAKCRALLHWD